MTVLFYTGVGSRRATAPALSLAEAVARQLAERGWVLRSGRAKGMDQAFERGAGREAHIFLPEPGFGGSNLEWPAAVTYERPTPEAYELAERFHPAWHACTPFARACHARNCHQVLGLDLNTPSRFLVCWTPGGREEGGTAQALRIARAYSVPAVNLATHTKPESVYEALGVEP